jgi:4-amino-4-deoxy-L-arabinose transferase-like glycosyltransferase
MTTKIIIGRTSKFGRILASFPFLVFLVALILRLVPVLLSYNLGIGLDDMFQYDMLARSLVAGDGYRWYAQPDLYLVQPFLHLDLSTVAYDPRGVLTSFRPPLYPAFLALIYILTGTGPHRFFIARLVQAFVGAVLAPLTYVLARRLFPTYPPQPSFPSREGGSGGLGPKAARIAAWVVACYPLLVIYPLSLATENLFFLLVLALTLVLLKAKDSLTTESTARTEKNKQPSVFSVRSVVNFFSRARWFILAGILLGLLALTRSVSLLFTGLAVLWVWFALRERKMAVVVFLGVTVVTLPWMVRNSLLHHRLIGIETTLGYNLYMGYHPEGSGSFQYPQSLDLLSILDDGLRDQIGQQKAWDFIQADPTRVPYLILRRLGFFFGLERRALTYFYSNNFFGYIQTPLLLALAAIMLLPFVLVSISSAFGIALIHWRAETILAVLFLAGHLIPHILILSEDRFHLAYVPFLAIFAAQFWTGGWSALKVRWQTRAGKIALVLASSAIILLLYNWGLELWRDAGTIAQLLGTMGNQTYFPY